MKVVENKNSQTSETDRLRRDDRDYNGLLHSRVLSTVLLRTELPGKVALLSINHVLTLTPSLYNSATLSLAHNTRCLVDRFPRFPFESARGTIIVCDIHTRRFDVDIILAIYFARLEAEKSGVRCPHRDLK